MNFQKFADRKMFALFQIIKGQETSFQPPRTSNKLLKNMFRTFSKTFTKNRPSSLEVVIMKQDTLQQISVTNICGNYHDVMDLEFEDSLEIRNTKMCIIKEQKQPPEVFYKKAVLKKFEIFTGKHLCQSLFRGCRERPG